jgi:dTDP-4-dehydrorhamnose reductase
MHRPDDSAVMNTPVHLVIGADGLVGGALVRRLRDSGQPVAATTRRRANVTEDRIYLDLTEPPDNWTFPWPIGVATICAGITKAQACKDDPRATGAVNNQGMTSLIAALAAAGAFVIFLSTNQVFDGSKPFQVPHASLSPITEYGRQKAEVERRMMQYDERAAIVRFAKILGPQPALIPTWVGQLSKGEPIHPFSDMTMAPIPLSCAVTVLSLVAEFRFSGIFQLSGQEDITYADAACLGAKILGLDSTLIQPVTGAQSGTYTEPIPSYTSLSIDRLRSTFGIVPPDARWTIETAFANPQLLAGA